MVESERSYEFVGESSLSLSATRQRSILDENQITSVKNKQFELFDLISLGDGNIQDGLDIAFELLEEKGMHGLENISIDLSTTSGAPPKCFLGLVMDGWKDTPLDH